LGVLAAMGILALSATVAQAGAGGSPTLLSGFFVCHGIQGSGPAETFNVESPVFGPVDGSGASLLQKIKLGKAALACAFARLFTPGSSEPIDPIPLGTAPEQMKCYPITLLRNSPAQPPTDYDATDVLVGPEIVPVPPTSLKFLCAPATFFTPQ
jgi:hypothetical protein